MFWRRKPGWRSHKAGRLPETLDVPCFGTPFPAPITASGCPVSGIPCYIKCFPCSASEQLTRPCHSSCPCPLCFLLQTVPLFQSVPTSLCDPSCLVCLLTDVYLRFQTPREAPVYSRHIINAEAMVLERGAGSSGEREERVCAHTESQTCASWIWGVCFQTERKRTGLACHCTVLDFLPWGLTSCPEHPWALATERFSGNR